MHAKTKLVLGDGTSRIDRRWISNQLIIFDIIYINNIDVYIDVYIDYIISHHILFVHKARSREELLRLELCIIPSHLLAFSLLLLSLFSLESLPS